MALVMGGLKLLAFLFVATVLGGVFGAVGDMTIPSLITGTPLGAQSEAAPIAWTVIAGVAIYAFSEVSE